MPRHGLDEYGVLKAIADRGGDGVSGGLTTAAAQADWLATTIDKFKRRGLVTGEDGAYRVTDEGGRALKRVERILDRLKARDDVD
jgi:hypothetical protein